MTSENLAAWQKQMSYTYESAAKALGISRATYGRYLKDGAPLYIGLACAALTARLAPWAAK